MHLRGQRGEDHLLLSRMCSYICCEVNCIAEIVVKAWL